MLKISLQRNTHIKKSSSLDQVTNQENLPYIINHYNFSFFSSITLINSIKIIKLNRLPVSHIYYISTTIVPIVSTIPITVNP